MILGLNHITIAVSDLERSLKFIERRWGSLLMLSGTMGLTYQ